MRTWAEIDLGALEENYRALRGLLPAGCRVLGVVKANAYGHGAVPAARRLEALGAEYLAAACLDEAAELREAGISAPILVLGPIPVEQAGEAAAQNVTATVCHWENARALSAAAVAAGRTLKIHLKADTGMSRLGLVCDHAHLSAAVEEMAAIPPCPAWRGRGW